MPKKVRILGLDILKGILCDYVVIVDYDCIDKPLLLIKESQFEELVEEYLKLKE